MTTLTGARHSVRNQGGASSPTCKDGNNYMSEILNNQVVQVPTGELMPIFPDGNPI